MARSLSKESKLQSVRTAGGSLSVTGCPAAICIMALSERGEAERGSNLPETASQTMSAICASCLYAGLSGNSSETVFPAPSALENTALREISPSILTPAASEKASTRERSSGSLLLRTIPRTHLPPFRFLMPRRMLLAA